MPGLDHQVVLRPPGVLADRRGLGVQIVVVGAQVAHGLRRALGEAGVELAQHRHHLAADAVAGVVLVGVGGVLHMGDLAGLQIGLDSRPRRGEQRADDLPRRGGMPARPWRPAPRARWSSRVSRLSSALWAVAMRSQPSSAAVRRRNSYRSCRPVSSTPRPRRSASAYTSPRSTTQGMPRPAHQSETKAASASAASPHAVVVVGGAHPEAPSSAQVWSRWSRHMESAPPDTAHSTAPPGQHVVFG